MKKHILFLTSVMFAINLSFSQQCLPDGITFSSQDMIDNFQQNYPNCFEIQGDVVVTDPDNMHITNLTGLNVITSILGDLIVIDNHWLSNFSGLQNLNYLGGSLEINNNGTLTNFSAIYGLDSIRGDLLIIDNGWLLNIDGLHNLSCIEGDLKITGCHELLNVGGLSNLKSIMGNLQISDNNSLTDIIGLGSLISIGNSFTLSYNYGLIDIDGINQLSSINGNLDISSNWELESIVGLSNLTQVNGAISIVDNKNLNSLEGLDNIDHNTIEELTIIFNHNLSTCEVESVCEYLSTTNYVANIGLNENNCNSVQEVLASCLVNVESENKKNIIVYPNPANSIIHISAINNSEIEDVYIFNHIGQKQLVNLDNTNSINISNLIPGMHYVEIVVNGAIYRQKLIVK